MAEVVTVPVLDYSESWTLGEQDMQRIKTKSCFLQDQINNEDIVLN